MKNKFLLSVLFSLSLALAFSLSQTALAHEEVDAKNLEIVISAEDLGIDNVGFLPDSPFYFLKEWARGIKLFFAFNPVSKAEVQLKIANEKAAELLEVDEETEESEDKSKSADSLKRAIENYNKAADKLILRIEALKEISTNPNIEKLLKSIYERTSLHNEILEELIRKQEDDTKDIADPAKDKLKEIVKKATEKEEAQKEKAQEQVKKARELVSKLEISYKELLNSDQSSESSQMRTFVLPHILEVSKAHLQNAEKALNSGSYGEAFGQARAAQAAAENGLKLIEKVKSVDDDMKEDEDENDDDDEEDEDEISDKKSDDGKISCTQEYNPVCGSDGKTYSNSCMAKAAGVSVKYNGECKKPESNESEGKTSSSNLPAPDSGDVEEKTVTKQIIMEADDNGFYPNEIAVDKGTNVELTLKVRTTNVYYGGLQFKSEKFDTGAVKPGESKTVKFTADESVEISSYWPVSNVFKAKGKVVAK